MAWSATLDSAGLLAATSTWRFLLTPTALAFLAMRAVAAVAAGLLLPALLSDKLGLEDNGALLIFVAPIVSLAVVELLVGRIAEPGAGRFDFTSLIGNLRALATADARRIADEARYRGDLKLIDRLSARHPASYLEESLINLLHTKLPSLKDAKERSSILLDGASTEEQVRRHEVATEIVKIDGTYARNLGRRRSP